MNMARKKIKPKCRNEISKEFLMEVACFMIENF